MPAVSLRRNGDWMKLGFTLVVSMWICHDAVNCQNDFQFLGEKDQDDLDELLKSITSPPRIRYFTETWWQQYTNLPDVSEMEYSDVESVTSVYRVHKAEIHCVEKEKINNRDAVKITLNHASNCALTKVKILNALPDICKTDCKIEFFQEENSKQVIMSGKTIEDDAQAMAMTLNKEKVKKKMDLKEAVPYWTKHSPTVLVSLLLAGLLLAALLIGCYVLKHHRGHSTKGMKLADETFQVDEENQGNTLVSVAPLQPQEPQAPKPSINGESPDGGKCQAPPTNGHQTTKSPMADTEL
ncbi:uncharacterized protein si:ch211-286o17.1 isoform X2 [Brienomyrus brachyistius]|uniref:uncharacterized protein si:ch211-286o17.1 isoform X2 n=1 Tax=Brienomyrus brachyistius TaxID=42636 RepID=UPI0020B3D1D8|nr:uncharacterized protein si:ch211-286o17.1 isoform X2 [Brienomyrus brachyistius]